MMGTDTNFTSLATGKMDKYASMVDEHSLLLIEKKKVTVPTNSFTICNGDINSEMITARINRFYDNVDLIDKDFYMIYQTKGGTFKKLCSNVVYSSDLIQFCWVLDEDATMYSGNITCALQILGKSELGDTFATKSENFTLVIADSLNEYGQNGIYFSWAHTVEDYLTDLAVQAGQSNATFVGTKAQFDAAFNAGTIPVGTIIVITDI